MNDKNLVCQKCGSHEALTGVQYNQGCVFPESKGFLQLSFGSEIIHHFCSNCGFIKESYIKSPEIFNKKINEYEKIIDKY